MWVLVIYRAIAFYYQSSLHRKISHFQETDNIDARTSPVFFCRAPMSMPMTRRRRRRCVCWLRFSLLHMSVVSIPSFHLPFLKIKIKINTKLTIEQAAAVGTPDFLGVFRRGIYNNNNNNNNNLSGKKKKWVDGGGRLWLVGWLVGWLGKGR